MFGVRIIVLKFGGSVLKQPIDIERAVHEIYRWLRDGYRVVAVVSAIGDTTDGLYRQASQYGSDASERSIARLVATGEWQSAALLGLALDRAGIPNAIFDETVLNLRTAGGILDAMPRGIAIDRLRRALATGRVVVTPGFIGRNNHGEPTLLGRGGSDLTALFLASEIRAERSRLIKDVNGLFEFDPKNGGLTEEYPRRFVELSWDGALALDDSVVQHKSVSFARDRQLEFEVAGLNQCMATTVGDKAELKIVDKCPREVGPPTQPRTQIGIVRSSLVARSMMRGKRAEVELSESNVAGSPAQQRRRIYEPMRIGMLGVGTVGWGVYQQLQQYQRDIQIVSVVVRDVDNAVRRGIPDNLVTSNVDRALNSKCDVVVELAGGISEPARWMAAALDQRKHVVTANKSVIAKHGQQLRRQANRRGVSLRYSAAVGGSVPMLEWVGAIARHHEITEILGVLNGSSNFILNRYRSGISLCQAIDEANEAGCTEQDPTRDIDGTDAAEKLVLLGEAAGISLELEQIARQGLSESALSKLTLNGNRAIRQIGRIRMKHHRATADVRLVPIPSGHALENLAGPQNWLQITTLQGATHQITGIGAGCRPTAEAVMADLLELHRDLYCCPNLVTRPHEYHGTRVDNAVCSHHVNH